MYIKKIDDEYINKIRYKYDKIKNNINNTNNNHYNIIANSLKVEKELSDVLYKILKDISDLFKETIEAELYILNSTSINAFSYIYGEKAFVILNSGLINLLDTEELEYIVAHEIAHCIYNHSRNNIDNSINKNENKFEELSADRLAFLVVENKRKVFSAIIKVVSGLDSRFVNPNIYKYLEQFDDLNKMTNGQFLNSSHPLFNIRIKALLLFENTEEYYEIKKYKDKAPYNIDYIDDKIYNYLISYGSSISKKRILNLEKKLTFWILILLYERNKELNQKKDILSKFPESYYENAILILKKEGTSGIYKKINSLTDELKNSTRENLIGTAKKIKKNISILSKNQQTNKSDIENLIESIFN